MGHRVFGHSGLLATAFLGTFGTAHAALPEAHPTTSDAQIVVDGTAEILVQPTTASFSVTVTAAAPTASVAREDGARITKMVMDALSSADLHRDEIRNTRLTVGPRWQDDESTWRQKRTAFEATNTIEIRSGRLEKVGSFIDAALGAGATGVSEVTFAIDDTATVRRQALSDAVAEAHRDAEALARAGGGTLGALLLLSTEEANIRPGIQFEEIQVTARRRSVSTELIPTQIKVKATVIGHWKFVTAPDAK